MTPTRESIFKAIDEEREYQDGKWGLTFDRKNTANDWVTYICGYATSAAPLEFNRGVFESNMRKVAALAIAAIERVRDDGTIAPRHFDTHKGYPIIEPQPSQGIRQPLAADGFFDEDFSYNGD